jgi:RNA polymerase sigma factor (sigma-70 family)
LGRKAVFEDLYSSHKDRLLTIAAALVGDRATAEDVVHDVFASVLRNGRWLRKGACSPAFLAVCVRNRAVDVLRRRKRRAQPSRNGSDGRPDLHLCDPADQAAQREEAEAIVGLVSRLPGDLREVVALRIWGEMGFDEIAQAQGTSKSTAHSRYSQALDRLRVGLTKGDPHE